MTKKLLIAFTILASVFVLSACSKTAELSLPVEPDSNCFWTYTGDVSLDITTEISDSDKDKADTTKYIIKAKEDGDYSLTFYYTTSNMENWQKKADYTISVNNGHIKEESATFVDDEGNELDPIHIKGN